MGLHEEKDTVESTKRRMSQFLTSTALPVYQGLFEYRIARETQTEFYGVTLFNGRKYDKAVIGPCCIMLYRDGVIRSLIDRAPF